MNLYKLDQEFATLEFELMLAEGEITQENEARIEALLSEFIKKEINYVLFIDKLNSDVERYKDLKKTIEVSIKSKENLVERLKTRLLQHMDVTGKEKIGDDLFSATKQYSQKVADIAPDLFPKKYVTIETTKKIDKQAIKRDVKIDSSLKQFITSSPFLKFSIKKDKNKGGVDEL